MIRKGRAPLAIMNVTQAQEVDVKVEQHTEKYVAPKKKWNPFGSSGHRLGSPVPGQSSTGPTNIPAAASEPAVSSTVTSGASSANVAVNESEPTISLQIRLRDGTRLVSRFNTSHTIGHVYEFVAASSPSSTDQSWVLMTTFPSKELSDKSVVLGDLAEFKRGGVVVQKGK
jgi:UBX domain-containing protein 1